MDQVKLTRTAKRRLLKLADFLDNLNRENFNLDSITSKNKNDYLSYADLQSLIEGKKCPERKCGSAGCAIGWTPAVFPKLVEWEQHSDDYYTSDVEVVEKVKSGHSVYDTRKDMDIPSVLFGMPKYDWDDDRGGVVDYLFMPEYYPVGRRGPKSVAKRIRQFVKNNGKFTSKKYPSHE